MGTTVKELLIQIRDALFGGGSSAVTLTATTASILAGGNLKVNVDLGTANKLAISRIKVVASASVDFDVLLYPKDTCASNYEDYANENNNLSMNDKFISPLNYEDEDASNELHMHIVNTDAVNASTFTYFIYCTKV